jgi:hypothetical protein
MIILERKTTAKERSATSRQLNLIGSTLLEGRGAAGFLCIESSEQLYQESGVVQSAAAATIFIITTTRFDNFFSLRV